MEYLFDILTKEQIQDFNYLIGFFKNSNINIYEFYDKVKNSEVDFTFGECRFIHKDSVYDIMYEEMKTTTYWVTTLNSDMISFITKLSIDEVEKMKENNEYEKLRDLMMGNKYVSPSMMTKIFLMNNNINNFFEVEKSLNILNTYFLKVTGYYSFILFEYENPSVGDLENSE